MVNQTRDSIADIWGERHPFFDEWNDRVDQRTLEEPDHWVQSACVLCSNGCGMDIGVKNGRIVGVRGRAVDIANRGRLGPKGLNGWEANQLNSSLDSTQWQTRACKLGRSDGIDCAAIALHHRDEPDVEETCELLASWSRHNLEKVKPLVDRYAENKSDEPERLHQALFDEPRSGSLALIRDLHDLYLIASEVQLCWSVLEQAANALRDRELKSVCAECSSQTKCQHAWLLHRIRQAAPQTLVVAT